MVKLLKILTIPYTYTILARRHIGFEEATHRQGNLFSRGSTMEFFSRNTFFSGALVI